MIILTKAATEAAKWLMQHWVGEPSLLQRLEKAGSTVEDSL